jgi:hypothetical protein
MTGRPLKMKYFVAALGASLLLTATSASAEIRIQRDFGGQIGPYLNRFAMVRDSGQRVVIDGPCLSACTLVTAVVPSQRICVTPRAILGFHAAWLPDEYGRPVISRDGTRVLLRVYPPRIRNWIRRHGGLTGRTIFLRGRELAAMYRPCA